MPSITTWTRLEPRARSEVINTSLQARVYDPHWMLARQWQFGEFRGEDAGSPVAVRLEADRSPLTLWAPGRPARAAATQAHPYDSRTQPLETLVEREPLLLPNRENIRFAAEAGLHFIRLLGNLGPKYRKGFLTEYAIKPLPAARRQELDAASLRYLDVMVGRAVDGIRLYEQLSKSLRPSSGGPKLPAAPAIAPGDQPAVIGAGLAWLGWYETHVSQPEPAQVKAAWQPERMEYEFAVAAPVSSMAGLPNNQLVLTAPEYTGERLDWHSFAVDPESQLTASGPAAGVAPVIRAVLPAPVNFRGAPSPRWWEFENADVNLGAVDAPPDDLTRLLLLEFALVYSNDFFLIPVDLPVGSVCRTRALRVWNTFGDEVTVDSAAKVDGPGRTWRMFELSPDGRVKQPAPAAASEMFFLPPALGPSLAGPPLEEVLFLRDEMANMAWGVELVVESPAGHPVNRHEVYHERRRRDEAAREAAAPGSTAPKTGPLEYRLSSPVPDHWIPLVPVRATGTAAEARTVGLRRGVMQDAVTGRPVLPQGRILAPEPLIIREEMVPRAGARVTHAYQYTRWIGGTAWLWTGRRKETGRGEGSSGLRFDRAEPT